MDYNHLQNGSQNGPSVDERERRKRSVSLERDNECLLFWLVRFLNYEIR